MVQIQKAEKRSAILRAATKLFKRSGYSKTTLRQIAEEADVTLSNLYSYFESKLDLLFTVYSTWLKERLLRLETEIDAIQDPAERLQHLLSTLWLQIPRDDSGFANNIMQALSTMKSSEYDASLMEWSENKVTEILERCLPASDHRRAFLNDGTLAYLIIMAFDGFVVTQNSNPNKSRKRARRSIELVCELLLPRKHEQQGRSTRRS